MNYKNCALLLLLLTPQLGAMERVQNIFGFGAEKKPRVATRKASLKTSEKPVTTTTTTASNVSSAPSSSKLTRAKEWLSTKYTNAKSSVNRGVTSAWNTVKDTASSAKDSASNKVTGTLRTYPKLCATASGLVSYLLLKPCVEQYMQWESEDKPVITGFVCALVGASIFGLQYLGKLPGIQSGVAASFIAGLLGAGLADNLYAEYQQEDTLL